MEVCEKADESSLTVGYSFFKEEAKDIDFDYQPYTVNADG